MKVLILNGGSSSLKYHLFDMSSESTILHGSINNLGQKNSIHIYYNHSNKSYSETLQLSNYNQALKLTFNTILKKSKIKVKELKIVGHRVVHGGDHFKSPVIIDTKVEKIIQKYSILAPLHNPINLKIIKAARKQLPEAIHIAVFDTSFHNTIPDFAAIYGLPYKYYKNDHLRRYGFHGNSHEYVAIQASQYLERPLRRLKLITCHLGNGASVCAINRGRSIDTSMGFTPLEGLVMGTRCGDLDPALLTYLLKEKKLTVNAIDKMLNKQSGLLGISGISNDMKVIEKAAAKGDYRALLAIKLFCYRVKKYIGSYMLALGWVNAIIFTGGMGENSRGIRMRILQDTEKLGFGIDKHKNMNCRIDAQHPVFDISHQSAHSHVLVIATNEELMMAKKCLQTIDYNKAIRIIKQEGVRHIPIGISAHHIHLSHPDINTLFGKGHKLTKLKSLTQPGQFACKEKINLIGVKGTVKNVRILGPARENTQVEISRTEEFKLGIDAPVRESGDLNGTPGITLEGEKGSVTISQGVICAKRHIHMTPDDAQLFDVSNGDHVMVKMTSKGRELIFGDVVVRINKDFMLEMHIDTDEANAAELSANATGILTSIQSKKEE